jgi:hypothetical protein
MEDLCVVAGDIRRFSMDGLQGDEVVSVEVEVRRGGVGARDRRRE